MGWVAHGEEKSMSLPIIDQLLRMPLCVTALLLTFPSSLSYPVRGASVLRSETAVDAVELFDRASLRECESNEDMARLVPDIRGADPMAAALLIECRG